tara:strand:- start:775 stop:966 length:192 start_codon:yes stop_codon:yes gene_type:complete
MKVKDLIKTLKMFDDNDEVIFYHLDFYHLGDKYDLVQCQLESILKTDDDLGVEITIEEYEEKS